MSGCNIALGRLIEERKTWRKNHPYGFVAKPDTNADGQVNMMVWRCKIPGKPNTDWEGGCFPISLHFEENYPSTPPTCMFPPGFFHPNVFPSGKVCISIVCDVLCWNPSITVKQILVCIQDVLDQPNPATAVPSEAFQILSEQPDEYRRRVRQQTLQYTFPV